MQDKVQWYEEVLAQDPGSYLFFPLARLYAENSEPEKAIQALENGLRQHPWHLEAKLLLHDLFQQQECIEKCSEITEQIQKLLKKYPGFWLTWSDQLENKQQHELALATRMLGLGLSGSLPRFSAILTSGLKALDNPDEQPETLQTANLESSLLQSQPEDDVQAAEAEALGPAPQTVPSLDTTSADESDALSHAPETQSLEEECNSLTSENEAYQTKTMAEILTAQGDYSEALRIYHHLLQKAGSEQEQAELENNLKNLQELQSRQEAGPVEPSSPSPGGSDKQQLIQQLEKLASRLESL